MTQTARESHTFVPLILKPRGRVGRLRVGMPALDPTLLKGLARACYWQSLLDEGQVSSQAEIARREAMDASDVTRWMRLTLLAPDLIDQLLAGQQPVWLTWRWLKHHRLPENWAVQRRLFNPELEDDDHAPEVLR